MLAVGDSSAETDLWILASMHEIGSLIDPSVTNTQNDVSSLAFSPSGEVLVTGDQNGAAYLWHLSQLPHQGSASA